MATPEQNRELRMQIVGLLLLALIGFLFMIWRAGWHAILPRSWW